MNSLPSGEACVVGSGPNGLMAAIELARAGVKTVLIEARNTIGGGCRTTELTLPGFHHDVCSTVHALALSSPAFDELPLAQYGLDWVHPTVPLAHPLDDGSAVVIHRNVGDTARGLGSDEETYGNLLNPMVERYDDLLREILWPPHIPRSPVLLAGFGILALRSASGLANSVFKSLGAKSAFCGVCAHSCVPLEKPATAAFGLVLLAASHAIGWPFARGGSQKVVDALAAYFKSLGGKIISDHLVTRLGDLAKYRIVILDITPRQFLGIAGSEIDGSYRSALEDYRYGMGVFKMDWALKDPIPWQAAECSEAGTIHLGGKMKEIAGSEAKISEGEHPAEPFVVLCQPTLFDPTRVPKGKHIAWAYCHVPNGSKIDMTSRIEAQVERFAPGFHKLILARAVRNTAQLEEYNPNCVGGDINGGSQHLWQMLKRPVVQWNPYRTPIKGVFLCSSSTPPGGGVHGMCGYHAAHTALSELS